MPVTVTKADASPSIYTRGLLEASSSLILKQWLSGMTFQEDLSKGNQVTGEKAHWSSSKVPLIRD